MITQDFNIATIGAGIRGFLSQKMGSKSRMARLPHHRPYELRAAGRPKTRPPVMGKRRRQASQTSARSGAGLSRL